MPSDGQHTVRSLRRATFPASSSGLRTALLVSPKCTERLCQGPWVSCHERTLCLEYFEALALGVTLPEEEVRILPCYVATGTPSMNTRLEVRA